MINNSIKKRETVKNIFMRLGTFGLTNSTCAFFFHDVPIPDALKKAQQDILKQTKDPKTSESVGKKVCETGSVQL